MVYLFVLFCKQDIRKEFESLAYPSIGKYKQIILKHFPQRYSVLPLLLNKIALYRLLKSTVKQTCNQRETVHYVYVFKAIVCAKRLIFNDTFF